MSEQTEQEKFAELDYCVCECASAECPVAHGERFHAVIARVKINAPGDDPEALDFMFVCRPCADFWIDRHGWVEEYEFDDSGLDDDEQDDDGEGLAQWGEFRTPEWVAAHYGISIEEVQTRLEDGSIPAIRLGEVWRIPEGRLPEALPE